MGSKNAPVVHAEGRKYSVSRYVSITVAYGICGFQVLWSLLSPSMVALFLSYGHAAARRMDVPGRFSHPVLSPLKLEPASTLGDATASGWTEPALVDVQSGSAGILESVFVRPGQFVKPGDKLAKLDTFSLEQQRLLLSALADTNRAKLLLARLQMNPTNAKEIAFIRPVSTNGDVAIEERYEEPAPLVTSSRVEETKNAVAIASLESEAADIEGQMDSIDRAIENATILAPTSGQVLSVQAQGHRLNGKSEVVTTIATANDFFADLVPDVGSFSVRVGDEVSLYIDQGKHQKVCEVIEISDSGSYRAACESHGGFVPGQPASGRVAPPQEGVVIPASAIRRAKDSKPYLIVQSGGGPRLVPVAITRVAGDHRVVVEGVEMDDHVLHETREYRLPIVDRISFWGFSFVDSNLHK